MTEQTKLHRESVVTHSLDQVSCEVDGVVVLMSVENGEYYKLNDVSSRIWELVQTPISVGALCDKLIEEFEVEPAQCVEEVLSVLETMLERKLISAT